MEEVKTLKDVRKFFSPAIQAMLHPEPVEIISEGEEELFCEKHGKYIGHVVHFDKGEPFKTACPKCIEEARQAEQAELERQEAEAKERHLIAHCKDCNIEPEYYHKTLLDYAITTPEQQKAHDAVLKMIQEKSGKLLILGTNGTGKTMLGSIAAKELNGKIYSMYEISTMIRQSYTNRAERTELEIVSELASISFLAIDEIGRTNGSKSEQDWLSYILDKRHTRNLPFMLMGNGHFRSQCRNKGCSQCLENFLGNDILSRLTQDTTVVIMGGKDYRRGQK